MLGGDRTGIARLKWYLIVVDDVWTVAAWDLIKTKLPENGSGSRIIVSTRIETVAAACSGVRTVDGDYIYRIKPLRLEDSKKLFLSRAFGSKNASCPTVLEAEMSKILKKCGGMPIAIISIASVLSSYQSAQSRDMWERVCKSIGSQMESHPTLEGIRQIVTLSYNHLHHYLKGCMMYLCIFPEDYVIVKDRLLKRWIAEGLVAEIRGLTLMEVAEAYYNELVSRSMIDRAGDVINYYDGRVETCRVHDMILEVMVSRSLECNFVSLLGGPYEGASYDRIRRLSIHGGEEAEESPSNKTAAAWNNRKNGMDGVSMENVRSLSVFGPEDHTKVFDRLSECALLRVLDLEDCIGIKNGHLRYVCRMYLLRFLSLKGTAISKMPEEVGELENLETLDVRRTNLADLPKTVSKLGKLEHVHISNKKNHYGWTPRQGLGRMKALRTVNKILIGSDAHAAVEMGELQHMRELAMSIQYSDDDTIRQDVSKNLARSLSKMCSLRWLNIGDQGVGKSYNLDFLHDIDSPPLLLQYLRFGTGISKLPDWVGSLDNLVDLAIGWTHFVGDQLFGPVCKLPNLNHLMLEAYYYKDRELVAETAHSFPALKDLHIDFYTDSMKVFRIQKGSMAKLETLSVFRLDRGDKKIVGIEHLTNLKEVRLNGSRSNPSLDNALRKIKAANENCPKSNQIKVTLKYE